MQSKVFEFKDESSRESLTVTIPEVLDPSYGMYTWPSAIVIAQMIWAKREFVRGKVMLELGSGTALPGIVAALCGAELHLSDSSHYPRCLDNSLHSCKANGLHDIPVHGITWGRFDPDLLTLPNLDLIIASDCFYDSKDFEEIIVTVSYLLDKNHTAEFWCAYQVRSSSRTIEHLLLKWNLQSELLPLTSVGAEGHNLAGSCLPGNHTIQIYIISRKQ